MKLKIKTQWNAVPSSGMSYFSPSQTLPNQALTILEILDRHTRGLGFHNMLQPVYNEPDTDPTGGVDIRSLDITERHELLSKQTAKVKTMYNDLTKSAPKMPKIERSAAAADTIEQQTSEAQRSKDAAN